MRTWLQDDVHIRTTHVHMSLVIGACNNGFGGSARVLQFGGALQVPVLDFMVKTLGLAFIGCTWQ